MCVNVTWNHSADSNAAVALYWSEGLRLRSNNVTFEKDRAGRKEWRQSFAPRSTRIRDRVYPRFSSGSECEGERLSLALYRDVCLRDVTQTHPWELNAALSRMHASRHKIHIEIAATCNIFCHIYGVFSPCCCRSGVSLSWFTRYRRQRRWIRLSEFDDTKLTRVSLLWRHRSIFA